MRCLPHDSTSGNIGYPRQLVYCLTSKPYLVFPVVLVGYMVVVVVMMIDWLMMMMMMIDADADDDDDD